MQQIGGSLLIIAILGSLFNSISSFSQIHWARKSDISGKRVIYIFMGNAIPGVFFFMYGFAASPLLFLILRSVQAFFDACDDPACNALTFEYEPSGMYAKAFAIFQTMCSAGYFIGNLIGGYLQAITKNTIILFVISGAILIAVGIVSYLILPEVRRWSPRVTPWAKEKARKEIYGIREIIRGKIPDKIKILFLGVLFAMLGWGMISAYLSLFIAQEFSTELVGMMFAVDSVSLLITLPIFGILAEKFGKKNILLVSVFLYIIYSFLLFNARSILLLVIAQIFSGLKWASFQSSIYAYTADISEEREMALNQAVVNFAISIGWTIGPLLAGALVTLLELTFREVFIMAVAPFISSFIILTTIEKPQKPIKGPKPYYIRSPFTEL